MIVNYLDVEGIPVAPAKADPPLVIDPYAMLTTSIPRQLLEAIAWRKPKVTQSIRGVENRELALGKTLQLDVESTDTLAKENPLSVLISKRSDHVKIITLSVNIVKR